MSKTQKSKLDVASQPTAATDHPDRREYVVTAAAPLRVAGRRASPGDVLALTEAEARGELLALHIRPLHEETPASKAD
ncbi:hypothetical protein [Gellertiella hungarica]|uniref:Uncharacterized protein n=1 Tax=Gellertiella hungarica TaxID=1572859 RepID=A0A7W6NL82_9HYPH|nr:hypothetical protein [Gellertiella hungarica]MBB4066275.1 hypothetical protein [Gellertiella hungarica]